MALVVSRLNQNILVIYSSIVLMLCDSQHSNSPDRTDTLTESDDVLETHIASMPSGEKEDGLSPPVGHGDRAC